LLEEKGQKRNRKFTKEEDDLLKNLVKTYGEGCWSQIAEKMPGRNRKQIRERYINFLKKDRTDSEFTTEEDTLILSYVQKNGRKWSAIAELLPGRTPIMIKNRYYAKLKRTLKYEEKSKTGEAGTITSQIEKDTNEIESPRTTEGLLNEIDSKDGKIKLMSMFNKENELQKSENIRESPINKDLELEKLKAQEKMLRNALAAVSKKIEKLREKAVSENSSPK